MIGFGNGVAQQSTNAILKSGSTANVVVPTNSPQNSAMTNAAPTQPTKDYAEDRRAVAGIIVTLSGLVMTAALAVLAGQVSFATLFFDKGKFYALRPHERKVFVGLNILAV